MSNNGQVRKILVIKLRNIGDVLLTAALFHNLREAFPDAHISALVNSGTQEMLTANPAVDKVIVYDRGIKKAPLLQKLGRELSFYRMLRRERFDAVLNLTEGDRGALVALVSGARVRAGVDPMNKGMAGKRKSYTHIVPRVPEGNLHAVEKNLLFLDAFVLNAAGKRGSFHFTQADDDRVRALLAPESLGRKQYFHAHVTSRWMFKAMPHAKAAFLLDRIAEATGLPMVLTCAPDQKELDYLATLRPLLRSRSVDLSGALTLKQLGALSAGARFFVGVDSAPMHMAAALDIPVLGIFGPSSVQEWGPWDNDLLANPYQAQNGVQRGGKHLVLQAARPCVPCRKDGCNGSKVSDCLTFTDAELAACAEQFVAGLAK